MSDDPDHDLLAGEYVLGTLDPPAREAAAALVARDSAFAAAVAAWERRLAPLAALAPPAAPPAAVWARIEDSVADPRPAPLRQRFPARARSSRFGLRFWQGATTAALGLAAALALVIVLRPSPPVRVAVLLARAGGAPLLALASGSGPVTIRPAGALAPVPAGREMELWALPPGAHVPRPLGALPVAGRRLRGPFAPGTEVMVSLEPAGGSPTGRPTGPVLFAGRLQRM